MALTTLQDVIVPEIFDPYVMNLTTELSAFVQAGIALEAADVRVPEGGSTIHVPHWNDVSDEDDEVRIVDTALTPAKIDSGEQVAVILRRAKAFKASDLAAELAGSDPLGAVARRVAQFWVRNEQKVLLSVLTGLDDAAALSELDISGLTPPDDVISAEAFVDATQVLGDHSPSLTAFAVHSATEAYLRKQNLIDFIPDANGVPRLPAYQGRRLIIDDGLPANAGVYTSYLFGPGAFARSNGRPRVPVEVEREALKHNETLVVRRDYILHPRGYAWGGAAPTDGAPSPSNTALATGTNWTRVYDPKRIPIVKFVHKLGA